MVRSFLVLNAFICVMVLLFSLAPSSWADNPPIPVPDGKGDYRRCGVHKYWLVVENDQKNGLNGRISPDFPKNYESEDCRWPEKPNINAWPVVAKFEPESMLNAVQVNGVTMSLDDNNGNPWLMVRVSRDKVCFVRANSRYIKPSQQK